MGAVCINRRTFLKGAAAAAAGAAAVSATACGGPSGGTGAPADPSAASGVSNLPGGAYFEQLGRDLQAAGHGTPQILIDLDRLDANADAIVGDIGRDRYRIVEKSLPSLDLLDYIRRRTGSDRFLLLHLPFLPALLEAIPTADVLVGKVQPTAAVSRFFDEIPKAARAAAASRVRFLVDGRARLDELAALAARLSLTLQAGVEIDVGLHRGGVRRPGDLPAVLDGFMAHAASIRFAGMLGYDGHIPFAPVAPGTEKGALHAAYRAMASAYQSFVDVLESRYAALRRGDLVLNSGGSATYPLHHGGVVNDVAAGGGMLRPASYPDYVIGALQPAVFIAAPVITHYDSVELPFIARVGASLFDGQQAIAIYGGGWPAVFVWPTGVSLAPLVSDPEGWNLVPNQTLLTAPASPPIQPGDWVFQLPRLADAIFQFEEILLVRGGRLQPDRFKAYPRRY